jgi:putative acetyltransferase
MKLMKYEPRFKDAFKALNVEWISKYFKVEKKDLEQLENPEECVANGGEIFFVVNEEGQAVGTTAMYHLGEQVYELAKMAVRPDYQGRGFSNLLMQACEDWAREQNAREIIIVSNTSLTPAITLYKKHGYIVTRLGQDPDYERGDIELRKKL